MSDCKYVDTPEQVGAKFDASPPLTSEYKFKELVGSLLYIATCTRPDISHTVSLASRTSEPTQAHWTALKRILRYLKGSKNLGISYTKHAEGDLTGFSDADYANDEETRKSNSGLCIFYCGAPINKSMIIFPGCWVGSVSSRSHSLTSRRTLTKA